MDSIFVERLWRSLKYEELYLNANATMAEAKAGIGAWLDFYNNERPHQNLGYRTRRQIYELWRCARSALPTGCASRFPSELRKRGNACLRPHTHRHCSQPGFDIDEVKGRLAAPPAQ